MKLRDVVTAVIAIGIPIVIGTWAVVHFKNASAGSYYQVKSIGTAEIVVILNAIAIPLTWALLSRRRQR